MPVILSIHLVLDLLKVSTLDNNKGFIILHFLQKLNWIKTFIANVLLWIGLIRSVNPLLYIRVEGKAIDRDFSAGGGVKPSAPGELITKQELVSVYRSWPFATSPNLPDLQKSELCKLSYNNDWICIPMNHNGSHWIPIDTNWSQVIKMEINGSQ